MDESTLARFAAKIAVDDNDCWIWIASCCKDGYGQFYSEGSMRRAHRVAYQHFIGLVPRGLDLDHLCRVRRCVNPMHLEPTTRAENSRRGFNGDSTQCKNGHLWTPENTGHYRHGGLTHRYCRECHRTRSRGYYKENRRRK